MTDTDTASDLNPPAAEERRLPGEPGLWVFLLGDMVIFAIFFVSFLNERAKVPELFQDSRESIGLTIGLVNTMVLLVSSLLVVMALENVRAGRRTSASRLFLGGIVCGLAFMTLKVAEYTHLVSHGHGPDVNAYFMWFFILTGTHLFHVVLGVAVLAVLYGRARRDEELTESRRKIFEGGACYWHLVDLLWMVLFPLVYLVA